MEPSSFPSLVVWPPALLECQVAAARSSVPAHQVQLLPGARSPLLKQACSSARLGALLSPVSAPPCPLTLPPEDPPWGTGRPTIPVVCQINSEYLTPPLGSSLVQINRSFPVLPLLFLFSFSFFNWPLASFSKSSSYLLSL